MRNAFNTIFAWAVVVAVLAPLFILAKDEKAEIKKAEKKAEFSGSKLIEKIKAKPNGKDTNEVWNTGRTFPLMFSKPQKPSGKKAKAEK